MLSFELTKWSWCEEIYLALFNLYFENDQIYFKDSLV